MWDEGASADQSLRRWASGPKRQLIAGGGLACCTRAAAAVAAAAAAAAWHLAVLPLANLVQAGVLVDTARPAVLHLRLGAALGRVVRRYAGSARAAVAARAVRRAALCPRVVHVGLHPLRLQILFFLVRDEVAQCRSSRQPRGACTSSTPRPRVSRCEALRCSGGASAAWRGVAVPPRCAAACGVTTDELGRAAGVPRRHGPAVRRARFFLHTYVLLY